MRVLAAGLCLVGTPPPACELRNLFFPIVLALCVMCFLLSQLLPISSLRYSLLKYYSYCLYLRPPPTLSLQVGAPERNRHAQVGQVLARNTMPPGETHLLTLDLK